MYLAKDGTEIQDEGYFETIEPQTLFVIAPAEAEIKTGKFKKKIYNMEILFYFIFYFFLKIFN